MIMLFRHVPFEVFYSLFFFFNDTATTEIYTLSLHDALPIRCRGSGPCRAAPPGNPRRRAPPDRKSTRLNSSHLVISYAVFCLKKKKIEANRRRRQRGDFIEGCETGDILSKKRENCKASLSEAVFQSARMKWGSFTPLRNCLMQLFVKSLICFSLCQTQRSALIDEPVFRDCGTADLRVSATLFD